jgi:LysM repeat protein
MSVNVKVPGPSGQSVDQEQSMFVLGDSDDEDSSPTADADFQDMPPPYTGALDTSSTVAVDETSVGETVDETADAKGSNPSKYYVQPGDTLRGIALRHGVDVSILKVSLRPELMPGWQGHKICQLNSLPFSVLSTTPHLLHTRRWLNLPPTGLSLPPPDPKVLEAHNRERAEKRFQFVTKEVDWRVAKAYVALAEDDNGSYKSMESLQEIRKHSSERHGPEARAVDQYLNDEEWEAGQNGRPRPKEFPFFAVHDEGNGKAMMSSRLGRLIWH